MSSSGASSGVSVESVSLLSSDRNETITHSTESGGDAMSGVSVGTGVGDNIEGVEVAVTTRWKRGMYCTPTSWGEPNLHAEKREVGLRPTRVQPLDGVGVASKIGRAVQ